MTWMRKILAAALVLAVNVAGAAEMLPPDVAAFVLDRELCDHFRAEPQEGGRPDQVERRRFVRESLEIHCPGTDRRLAALKQRYRGHAEVERALERFEARVESPGGMGSAP